jgi:hypothetical protein
MYRDYNNDKNKNVNDHSDVYSDDDDSDDSGWLNSNTNDAVFSKPPIPV